MKHFLRFLALPGLWLLLATAGNAQILVHYWNFNNSVDEPSLLAPSASLVTGASIVHIQGGTSAIQTTSNTGQGFDITNPNARNGDPSATHLRFNNPIGGTLVFSLPTTGYQQVVVKYATRRSGSGAGTQKIEYSTDGTTFDSLTVISPVDGNPTEQTLDFSAITAASNNANFKIRITFQQGTGGTGGNNRFDNFTLDAIPFGADQTAPTVVFSPVDGAIDQAVNTAPTLTFNEDVRLLNNAPITPADIQSIVQFRLNDANGTPVAFTGSIAGRTITLTPNAALTNAQAYYVALDSGEVEDTSNNAIDTVFAATFTTIAPQTSFQPGDIVPVAYRMNATATEDEVAFLTFVNILPGTKINLTDAKYTDNAQPQCPGGITWTSPAVTLPAGTVFVIQNDAGTASVGTVTGSTFGLSSNGDQAIMYTGTAAAPAYITALSSNAWVLANTACGGSLSKIPAGLQDSVSAINLSTAPGNVSGNTVNAYYNGPQTGSTEDLREAILNPANWVGIGGGTAPQTWPNWNFPGPPAVTGAAVVSSTSIRVAFNRDLDSLSAVNLANYTGISGLASAVKSNNGTAVDTVVLTYSAPFMAGTTYTLTVADIVDTEGRNMVDPFNFTFTYTTRIGFKSRFVSVSEDAGSAVVLLNVENPSPSASATLRLRHGKFSTGDSTDLVNNVFSFPIDLSTGAEAVVQIPVREDIALEQDEYLVFFLENLNGTEINGRDFITVYIRDNDRQAPAASNTVELTFKARYSVPNPTGEEGIAEIVAHDPVSQRLFTMSTGLKKLDVVDFANPLAPATIQQIDMSSYGSALTSVAVKNGVVAVAVAGVNNEQENGSVVFFDTNGQFIKQFTVGALPDMVTFSPDGNLVLTANEGQPSSNYSVDPEGSVSVINISAGVNNATQADVSTISFVSFNSQSAALVSAGVRYLKRTSTLAQDLEPEFITVSSDSKKAWVTLQENNAVAEINLENKTVSRIIPLGTKDYSEFGNGLDLSDQGGRVHISNWPVKGFFIPDAMANYTVGNTTYLVTANEGDEKEYDGLNERTTVDAVTLDSAAFPNRDMLRENHNMGRFRITNTQGDTDSDGDYDELYCVGARSFTIWNATDGSVVYDSGDDFEMITSKDPYTAKIFNADNENNTFKARSRAKGPEPEGVAVARIGAKVFAFITLERVGGVMTYDITDPQNPVFSNYVNSRDTMTYAGDNGPEGIIYIAANQSPDGKAYVISANELSGTLAIFEVTGGPVSNDDLVETEAVRLFPNPVTGDRVYFTETVDATLLDLTGKRIRTVEQASELFVGDLAKGIYLVQFADGATRKVVLR
jgi:hypothetical protein